MSPENHDEFCRQLAHDLRTPLATIQFSVQGMLRQLRKGPYLAPEVLQDKLVVVERSVQELAKLITEMPYRPR